MTVVHKPFIILDIQEIQKAEMKVMGFSLHKNPDLDMYRVKAILKSYMEKTQKGRDFLKKIGLGEKMNELDMHYMEYAEAFTFYLPMTHKTLNENKYHVGGEIMIAYYPTNVWATFHTAGEPDNNNDRLRNVTEGY